jgi:hypothetical protein
MADTIPLVDVETIAENLNDQRSAVADYIQDAKPSAEVTNPTPQVESQAQNAPKSESFNPSLHAVGKDGQPVLTKTGKFRKQRVVSTVGKTQNPAQKAGVTSIVNGGIGTNEGQRKMAANVATDSTFAFGMILGGTAAKPIVDLKTGVDERYQLFCTWDNYLKAKNINDIPAGVALAIGLSGYFIRVSMLEATRQKTKSFWGKMKDKIVNVTASKVYATQSVSRNDGERKDNPSTKDSGGASSAGDTYPSAYAVTRS